MNRAIAWRLFFMITLILSCLLLDRIMSQPAQTAKDAIDALVVAEDKTTLEMLKDLEEIQEHVEKAIDATQDILCNED